MLNQDFLTARVWDQHLFWRPLIWKVAFYCFCDLGWRKGVINLTSCQNPHNLLRVISTSLCMKFHHSCGFQLQQRYILNVLPPVFLSRLIEGGSKMKHLPVSLTVPWKVLSPSVLKMENKTQDSNFLFLKAKARYWGTSVSKLTLLLFLQFSLEVISRS